MRSASTCALSAERVQGLSAMRDVLGIIAMPALNREGPEDLGTGMALLTGIPLCARISHLALCLLTTFPLLNI